MSSPKELEFSEELDGGGGDVDGDIGGEIFVPMLEEEDHEESTLDEPVSATLVSDQVTAS